MDAYLNPTVDTHSFETPSFARGQAAVSLLCEPATHEEIQLAVMASNVHQADPANQPAHRNCKFLPAHIF